jgi:hypothetical protein
MDAFFDAEARGGRAIIRLLVGEGAKRQTLRLEIDTGANRAVFVSEAIAKDLCPVLEGSHSGILADGSTREAVKGTVTVEWFGTSKSVEVFGWAGDTSDNRGKKNRIDGLAGRDLFLDASLHLDFVNRKITVTRPAPEGA